MGDCYIINGHLWVYTNSSDPGAVNGFIDAGNLQGPAGNGISSITKTGTSGLTDTYTINFTNGTSTTFTVTNGANGTNGTNGQDGAPGQKGQDGADGKSAYQIWLDAGNTGTQADFLASLVGAAGSDGRGIVSVAKTATVDNVDTYTITYTSGSISTFTVTNGINGTKGQDGATGPAGRGITSVTKTSTSGLVDTYTITYTSGSSSTFTVTNGADGQTGAPGQNGAPGADGDDGISITGTTINANKHLIVSFSDNTNADAGDVTIRSEQYNFVLSAANWVQQQDGSYNYTYSNAAINSTNFIDVGPAAGITENQLNGLLGAKMIIQAINNGSIVFKAYGE
nr:MAG TPA: nucleoid-associated protein [Caudoviricetes sp.]